jgi:soluble cytochrome b562
MPTNYSVALLSKNGKKLKTIKTKKRLTVLSGLSLKFNPNMSEAKKAKRDFIKDHPEFKDKQHRLVIVVREIQQTPKLKSGGLVTNPAKK